MHNRFFRSLLLLLASLWLSVCAHAQTRVSRAFNVYNGLASDHVYNTITDHNGYLWIATTKGVIKYNGYSFRTFNAQDGLPKEDVWRLVEDKAGKIWLGCITDEIGYIYNDKYYGLTLNNEHQQIYPNGLMPYEDGVIFLTAYSKKNLGPNLYLINAKNEISQFSIPDSIILNNVKLSKEDSLLLHDSALISTHYLNITGDGKMQAIMNNRIFDFTMKGHSIYLQKIIPVANTDIGELFMKTRGMYVAQSYILQSNQLSSSFWVVNKNTGLSKEVFIADYGIKEDIQFIHSNYTNDNMVYVITKSNILTFKIGDSASFVSAQKITDISSDTAINGGVIKSVCEDKIWGTIYGTQNKGIIIQPPLLNPFKEVKNINLDGYKYLGSVYDSLCFWWNPASSSLLEVTNGLTYKTKVFRNTAMITKVVPFAKDSLLFLGTNNYFLINNGTELKKTSSDLVLQNTFKAYRTNDNKLISVSNVGLMSLNLYKEKNKQVNLDPSRYTDIAADMAKNKFWAYNNAEITVYVNEKNTLRRYSKEDINNMGLKKVDRICIDSFSNIFISDNKKVILFDELSGESTRLKQLDNINISDCELFVYKNHLLITGKIGIIILDILGKGKLSEPRIYPNINNYIYINYVQIAFDKITLTTDKGALSADILNNNEGGSHIADVLKNYKLICKNAQNTLSLNGNDTLVLDQTDLKIQLNTINPVGNGITAYAMRIGENNYTTLTANEINLAGQKPDEYYVLKIKTNDDIWISNEYTLVVYIKPYWYQTKSMVRIIWGVSVIAFLLLITGSVLITRRYVIKANQKRNIRMEMELKAIYAQINPHFIFNSLNSALLLVSKNSMDEAYSHISKFSQLLRSYIKSSRNKFITVREEITNLKNYIELQQVRFRNKFSYEIVADQAIFDNSINIPALLLQPFVENAIEHGLLNNVEKGHLLIKLSMVNETTLICTIDDDGIGREKAKAIRSQSNVKEESYGNELVKDLVKIFNAYEKVNVDISYKDKLRPQTGTIVTITIKYL